MASVQPVPAGYHTVTPYLHIRGAAAAIELYQKAFGAEELMRMPGPGGVIMHAEIRIGDSIIMITDENEQWNCLSPSKLGGTSGGIALYVPDVNVAWDRAVGAGMKVLMPLQDMFWGDRYGKLVDPFGHEWSLSQHVEDVPPGEMEQRAADAMKQMGA